MKNFITLAIFLISTSAFAATMSGKYFDKAVIVIFENEDQDEAIKQPFFAKLAKDGANFTNLFAITRPSQPNYWALTSGSFHGENTNSNVDLDVKHIADLMEAKGLTWKVYAEDYPGNCFLKKTHKDYARKHNPFISYKNIQNNPQRCNRIVNDSEFETDYEQNKLPNYSFFIPNNKSNGHDTGVDFASKWYAKRFDKLVNDPKFLNTGVLITTFDEGNKIGDNHIYTSILGSNINPGNYSQDLNLYSLLKLMEENWSLGTLSAGDKSANSIPETIWKN